MPGVARSQAFTSARLADGFDMPVGKPDAAGYYVYRGFSPYGHLGEDWNGNGGGNTDEGDPVYSIAHGVVVFSEDYRRGWGNVVIIRHAYRENNGQINFVDSLYGHLKVRSVKVGQQVTRGQYVGTIGRGPYRMYAAHLHFEIRKDLRVGMRRDLYPKTYTTYHSPRTFLKTRRRLRLEDRLVRVPINTFLKSNPNKVFTSAIDVPKADEPTTVRPSVPEEMQEIIAEETSPEEVTPEKTKSLFEKLFGKD
jgi:murein DD-endopeptidase MepM/ murein hydrolase activator NlpD